MATNPTSDWQQEMCDVLEQPGNGGKALDAVDAVLALHVQGEAQRRFDDRRPVCQACDDGRSVPRWPCATIREVAGALGVEVPDA